MELYLILPHRFPGEDHLQEQLLKYVKNFDIEFILKSVKLPKSIKPSYWIQRENDKIIFALKLESEEFEISYLRSQKGNSLKELIRIRNGSTSSSPIIENYTYDPFGIRIKIERNDSAQTKIYTPFKELMRIVNSSGNYDFTYIYQDGQLVARVNPDGSKYFYHPDHLGSTSLITDQNGNVVEQTFYSPFGDILSGGTAENKLYTGQMKDFPCQYYYGKRYFSPCLGMFTQADPTIYDRYNPQYLNRYAYALNNPYRYVDAYGLWAVQIGGSVSGVDGIVGGTLGGGIIFSYDDTNGWQFGLYASGGGGVAVGGGGSVSFDVSFTPSARTIRDIEGFSTVTGGEVEVGVGAGYSVEAPLGMSDTGPTFTGNIGFGGKGELHSFVTYTSVLDFKDIFNPPSNSVIFTSPATQTTIINHGSSSANIWQTSQSIISPTYQTKSVLKTEDSIDGTTSSKIPTQTYTLPSVSIPSVSNCQIISYTRTMSSEC